MSTTMATPLTIAGPLSALTAQCITWTLGRRVVVLERRGGTWRMVPRIA